MPTYIRLVKAKDPRKVAADPAWGPEAAAKVFERHGGRIVDVWATLGPYDFVGVVEAPDDATMLRISAEVGSLLGIDAVTLPATKAREFLQGLRSA